MRDATAHQTLLSAQSEWWWNRTLERSKVVRIDLLREAKSRINDGRIDVEEVLSDLAGTGILVAEARDERSRLAVVVELEVDASLREDSALELGESGVLLNGEAVLEDKTCLEVVT